MTFRPRYITFDCYGTLTRFRMGDMAREMFADRVAADRMDDFIRDFSSYRLDEILGPWKPYRDVLVNAIQRTGKRWGFPVSAEEGEKFYVAVPTWGPHPDVPAGLSKVAGKVFRIGHIGDLNELMLLGAISGAEMAMLDNGVKIQAGSGVGAAQEFLRDNPIEKQAATPKAA